jgi:hypothetical protein
VALAQAGLFINEPNHLGPGMAVAIFVPVAVGLGPIAASPTARRIIGFAPLGALVAIQVYPVVGALFLVLLAAGGRPAAFALPAGFGDVAVGLAAPVVGLAAARRPHDTRPAAWCNTLGIVDLLICGLDRLLDLAGHGAAFCPRRVQPTDHRLSARSRAALCRAGLVHPACAGLAAVAQVAHGIQGRPVLKPSGLP